VKIDMASAVQQLEASSAHLKPVIGIETAGQAIGNGAPARAYHQDYRLSPSALMAVIHVVHDQPVGSQ
jgi:hypothetical protein